MIMIMIMIIMIMIMIMIMIIIIITINGTYKAQNLPKNSDRTKNKERTHKKL